MKKQETLEEAAERFYTTEDTKRDCNFIEGAKWQQEQGKKMYSEEEVLDLLYKRDLYLLNRDEGIELELPEEWLKQFKNK
jgi:hypothetical protein